MIGTNVLMLNKATMIKAVEHYLNDVQLKEAVKVTDVDENRNDHAFEVTFTHLEEDEKGE